MLAVAAVLGGQALLRDQHARLADNIAKHDALRLFDCGGHGGAPTGIVISTAQQTLSLQRSAALDSNSPTRWRLVAPLNAPADDVLVDAFVAAACSQESLGAIAAKGHEPKIDLALFHLDPPKHLITLVWDGNSRSTLAVGDSSGFNNKLYVRRSASPNDGVPVEQIDDALTHPLQRDVQAWRERRLLIGVQAADVAQVDVSVAGVAPYTVTTDGHGHTAVATTAGGKLLPALQADPIKAREWLSTIVESRAEQFVADQPDGAARKRFGLAAPKATLTVTQRGGARHTFWMGQLTLGQQTHLFVQRQDPGGPIVRLSTSALWQQLAAGPQALEDMHVLQVEPSDVACVAIVQGDRTTRYRLEKAADTAPSQWRLLLADHALADAQVDQETFTTALSHVLQLRAAHIVTRNATPQQLKQAGLIVPKHTLSLFAEGDRPLAILWLGNRANGQLLVTDDQKQTIWSVFEGTAETFTADPQPFLTARSETK